MPFDPEPKLLPATTERDVDDQKFRSEMEAIQKRQRELEEEYERRRRAAQSNHGNHGSEAEAPPKRKPPRNRRLRSFSRRHPLRLAAIIAAVVAVLIAGYFLLRYLDSYESTDDAQINAHLDPVTARINGTVIGVYVENTDHVTAGQLLVDLDPRDDRAALDRAQGNLAQAEGQLASASPNVPITETTNETAVSMARSAVSSAQAALAAARHDYDSALADLRQAQANNREAQADEVRFRELVAKDEVSRQQYDQKLAAAQAQAALVAARTAAAQSANRLINERQSALADAQSRLDEALRNNPRQLASRRADIDARQGAVATAHAELITASLQLSYTKIRAPVAGIVGNRNVEPGQRVEAGEQLLVITRTEDMWVDANFKETQIRRMRPGQSVTIHVDALDQDFQGVVENLSGATGAEYSLLPPENATGNYVKVVQRLPVRIRFRKGQSGMERLRPGMSVEPKVWL